MSSCRLNIAVGKGVKNRRRDASAYVRGVRFKIPEENKIRAPIGSLSDAS